jgi:hypothetical protein
MTETSFTVETGRSSEGLSVRILDEISRTLLASFRLDAEQAWAITGGGIVHVSGEISARLDRVGKLMRNESATYSIRQLNHVKYGEQEAEAARLAKAEHPGWDSYEARRHRGGLAIKVVMRKWVAID